MSNSANKVGIRQPVQFRWLFSEVIPFQATVDVASNADAAGTTEAITVPGAALGDFVMIAPSLDMVGSLAYGYVSAANTVSIRFQNESGSLLDLASQTVRGLVLKAGPGFDNLA